MGFKDDFDRVLAGARAGEEWAWREIYDTLAPAVIGYLRARSTPDPEDVAGEVFVQVVRDLPRFDGDESGLRAWVFTIARNRMLDQRRHRSRHPVEPVADPGAAVREPAGDVEEDAMARIDLGRVTAILAGLSDEQRDVLLLRIVGDLTVEQVAGVLGKRAGAVKQLQRRGLRAVRKQLERDGVPTVEREGGGR